MASKIIQAPAPLALERLERNLYEIGAVNELAGRNPTLAASLADVGAYLADDLAFKFYQAQDVIEEARDARLLRKLAKRKL